ncbi:MAG: CvpA family protein [Planctomycetota bacterium]|jgi:hypothetical protein
MVSYIGILAGIVFAWLAVKKGFYEIWAMLFNIVVSTYLAIFLRPTIKEIVPDDNILSKDYLTMLAIWVVFFLILQGISFLFFTGRFKVPFPKLFDTLIAAVWGFLTGFLIWSFIGLLICTSELSQKSIVSELGFNYPSQQANISYICWWGDLINKIVLNKNNYQTTEEMIALLIKSVEEQTSSSAVKTAEPNAPENEAPPEKPIEINEGKI